MIDAAEVAAAKAALLDGQLAIVPTDTVYGLAAALDSSTGIEALYALKNRLRSQPCQVLVYTDGQLADALAPLDAVIVRAARALLPGPATCIVPDPTGRYAAASGDQPGAVGLRAPRVAGAILALDVALIATSANDPGGPDPAALDEVPARIRAAGVIGLDAGRLPGIASAVVDLRGLTRGESAHVVRPGPDPDDVSRRLGSVGVAVRDSPLKKGIST